MQRPFLLAALTLALVVPGRAPASAATPAVLAPIAAFVKTSNAGDRAGLIALFAPDAAIVDDFAPYRFPAPAAAAHWYDGFGADAAAQHQAGGVIVAHPPSAVRVSGARAWASIPLDYRYTRDGRAKLETGSLIFTVRDVAGTWKITSMSWARLSDTDVSAAHAAVPRALRSAVDAFAAAADAGRRAAVIASFTADAALVDEFAPYRFAAPGAAAAWYDRGLADANANHTTGDSVTFAAPSYAGIAGPRAWVVVPARYAYARSGTATVEHGAVVMTARRTPAGWKLTTMSWAQLSVTRTPTRS